MMINHNDQARNQHVARTLCFSSDSFTKPYFGLSKIDGLIKTKNDQTKCLIKTSILFDHYMSDYMSDYNKKSKVYVKADYDKIK